MGRCVRASSFQLRQCRDSKARLIRLAGVALGFRERLVAEHGHDLVRGTSRFCKPPARCLAEAVWLAFKGKTSGSYCVTYPLAEAVEP